MPASVTPLGPGTISVGEVGSEVDFSCQVNNAQVAWDKTKDDDQTVLCGEVVPGNLTFTSTLSGNLFEDLSDPAGIVAFSWANKGKAVPFSFIPNTAAAAEVSGTLVITPITVGGDTAKANMAVDFEWDIVGDPTLTMSGTPLTASYSEPTSQVA